MASGEASDESAFSDSDFEPDSEGSAETQEKTQKSSSHENNAKQYKTSKWKKQRELMASAHKDVSVEIPVFASTRRWISWAEFEEDFDSYLKKHWLIYRKRNNVKTSTNNSSLATGKYAYVNFPVSEKKFDYVYRQYYCTHGLQRVADPREVVCRYKATPVKQLRKPDVPKSFLNNSEHDRKRVGFIKLKRGGSTKDKLLVKSDVEKHNIALDTLAPLITDMVQSSSEAFFKKLATVELAVKELITSFDGMKNHHNSEHTGSLNNSDTANNEQPSQKKDAFQNDKWLNESDDELAELLTELAASTTRFGGRNSLSGQKRCLGHDREMELTADTKATKKRERSTDSYDEDAMTTLNIQSKCVNGADQHAFADNGADQHAFSGNSADPSALTFNGTNQSALADGKPPTENIMKKKARKETQPQFSIFSLPKRIQSSKNNSRKRGGTKQLKHPALAVEISIEEYSKGVPIGDVVAWLERSNNHDKIEKVLKLYPVVRNRPRDAMASVIVDASKARGAIMSIGVVFGYSIVQNALATLRSDISISSMVYPRPRFALQLLPDKTPYHESLLWTMQEFYRLKLEYREYSKAVKWLSRNWVDDMFETDCLDVPGMMENELARAILSRLNFSSLSSYIVFTTAMEKQMSVTLMEIVGTVPGKEWLKDSPISLLLQLACVRHGHAAYVESIVGKPEQWTMPKDQVRDIDFVIAPCNTSGIHWTLVILDLSESNAMVYDPLDNGEFREKTRERIKHVFFPTVDNWRRRKFGENTCFPRWKMSVLPGPKQPDGVSCGVFIASTGWAFLHGETEWLALRGKAPRQASTTLRMRMLYHLLCSPEVKVVIPESELSQDVATIEKLLDELIAKLSNDELKE
ncbi:hypothetical protein PF011_g20789 [Phytophthora fragariae]|uniref:Ubiquitin-like protease family profile domain-containing protein n=1 Tax=Phytophthora fragariae TaxID=53985 RepID=A0A6A3IYF2_9STRA|nr:hypothetical protein PF011_g20789 [Phytophthora fragariae]